jgi:hypothetical protein
MHPLLNGRWVAAAVLLGSSASVSYAFSIVWPAQAAVLYVNCDTVRVGYISGYERHDTNAWWLPYTGRYVSRLRGGCQP